MAIPPVPGICLSAGRGTWNVAITRSGSKNEGLVERPSSAKLTQTFRVPIHSFDPEPIMTGLTRALWDVCNCSIKVNKK